MKKLILILFLFSSIANAQWLEYNNGNLGHQPGLNIPSMKQYALDFDGSTEYLSCTPALRLTGEYSVNFYRLVIIGDTSFASNQIYGSWSFTVNKQGDNDVMDIYFVNDVNALTGNSGYMFRYGNDEKMYLYSVASGTPTARITSSGTYAINNNHTVVITRNTNGAFTFTANGTSVGTVTNATYTYSNYCFTDFTGTTSLTNVIFQQGEGSLDLNSYERIYHSDNRNFTKTGGFAWAGAGTHSIDTTSTDKRTGTYSGKIISTDVGDSTTNYISLPAVNFDTLKTDANGVYEKYTLEGWARGVGVYGADTLINGSITGSATGWVLSSGAVYGTDNIALTTYNTSGVSNDVVLVVGRLYKIIYTLTISSGSIKARVGTGNAGTSRTASGTYTEYQYCAISTKLFFDGTNCTGTIESVSAEPITQPSLTLKIGNQVKTVTGISCVPATFTKFVFNFQSNAIVSNQPIQIYLNQADTVYVDDVSLTKSYDMSVLGFILGRSTGLTSNTIMDISSGSSATASRYIIYKDASTDNFYRTGIYDNTGNNTLYNSSVSAYSTSAYQQYNVKYNRLDSVKFNFNGTNNLASSIINIGKLNVLTMSIGYKSASASSVTYINANIGHIQIIKFTDISQSNVNSTTLTTAYNRGYLKLGEWTGGSPIEVAFYDWKGSTTNEILSDKSGTGNNLTGTNITIDDRVKVKSKFK